MGRDKTNERRTQHFAKLERRLMECPAWRAVSPSAMALYPWIRLEWHGPDANNNGKISLSVRQAAERLGVGLNRAARAFHELQAKGFIVVTQPARLGVEGQARGPMYEITELALPNSGRKDGLRLFLEWQEGGDCAVHKGRVNKPTTRAHSEPKAQPRMWPMPAPTRLGSTCPSRKGRRPAPP